MRRLSPPPRRVAQATVGRQVAATLAGGATATLGALILGEYDFSGITPYVAGLLFGLVVAEVVLSLARSPSRPLALVAGVQSGLGLLTAAWISSGSGVAPIPVAAFVAVALATLAAGGWVLMPSRRRPAAATGEGARPPPAGEDGLDR